ncbi:hypothetical protein PAPYR_9348 [Paratrimastix pyriformis]|uniref:Uncharacterized protein n=1 Tax=Paratrimastix pyriformis TaxID=342808 RepID=A0ABQ8UA78_9EUKA|nr:hypothetical protein PAPYR_9348 [Paratrimastix pyriformis]
MTSMYKSNNALEKMHKYIVDYYNELFVIVEEDKIKFNPDNKSLEISEEYNRYHNEYDKLNHFYDFAKRGLYINPYND